MREGHLSTIVFYLDNCLCAGAPGGGARSLECAGNTKCVAIGNRRHSFLLIIAGYFVRAAAIFVPGPRNVRFRIADFPRFSSLCGPRLPTCALQQVGSYLGYSVCGADAFGKAALDPAGDCPAVVSGRSP